MEPKNHPQQNGLPREPGRRYAAGRVRPRAGTDIRQPVRGSVASAPPPTIPSPPKSDVSKPPKKVRKTTTAKPALPRPAKSIVLKRQMVERAKEHKKKVKRMHRRHLVGIGIALTIIVSFGIIAWSFQDLLPEKFRFLQPKQAPAVQENTQTTDVSMLDETAVSSQDLADYAVADDAPRILRIPKIELESRVRRVGVSLSGEPVGTSNIFDVGWFEQNGKPNASGAVLMNGHSIGPTKNGIFANLKQLQPTDIITVELGNGTVVTYRVSKVQEYPLNQIDMSAAVQPIDPTKKGLNLMTTSNRYSTRSDVSYRQLIVFALQQ